MSGLILSRTTIGFLICFAAVTVWAQPSVVPSSECPRTTTALYSRIRSIGLDPQRVYHVRGASIDRTELHIDLDDGTLAFTEDICGRITGAFFEGDGELRLRPPNRVERGSLALFTGMAILEEQFTSGYLRFNDDTAAALQGSLSAADDGADFVKEWSDTGRVLAETDALRLLLDFSHFLPAAGGSGEAARLKFPSMLHAHLLGKKLGAFEIFWDATNAEQLWVGQPRLKDGVLFFDIWTSFTAAALKTAAPATADIAIEEFRIRAAVQPPTRLQASTNLRVRVKAGGQRAVLFELSRYLKVEAIEADGRALDFIQNQALEGTQLQRKGNDLIAVVFPAELAPGQEVKLRFSYAGDVLSEAANGLLFVGERGTWYPNFGLSPAQYDMEFHYPAAWTLVATGKQVSRTAEDQAATSADAEAEKVSRWISERPIPVAGFNLGKYVRAEAKAGAVLVEAFGTKEVEKSFPKAQPEIVEAPRFPGAPGLRSQTMGPMVTVAPAPSPARDVQAVADKAALAIRNFSQWFGPYPYGSLALTQMPGQLSQGWPGLVFLSSFAFLSPQEQTDLRLDSVTRELDSQVLVHETAHQWWGNFIQWKSYRDQWISEGLANYASLLMLEQKNPAQFREVLEKYRRDLVSTTKDGEPLRNAGPVTLGLRLESSHFAGGYEAISYERGTWLFHMLRCMLRDAAARERVPHESEMGSRSRKGQANPDELFFRALRKVRERYAGKSVSTREMLEAFEEELPRPLWFEGRRKLDWFLEGWIEGTAIPELEAEDVRILERDGVTTVTGVIVQKGAPDDLVTAIPVYAVTRGNAQVFLGEVLADGRETTFHLTGSASIRRIVLDPKQTILTTLK